MLPYAAYLRVYEPVIAFPEPLRSVWTAYAESGRRPRRVSALDAEHGEAVRRLAAVPPVAAPDVESPHAYVRRVGETTYVCPWQTRLRSWLAFSRFHGALPPVVESAFVPRSEADRMTGDFERWKDGGRPLRPHIMSSTWHVPLPWFAPFDPGERYLSLGAPQPPAEQDAGGAALGRPDGAGGPDGEPAGAPTGGPAGGPTGGPGGGLGREHAGGPGVSDPTMAAPTRTLIYVTPMAEARRRVDRALRAVRDGLEKGRAGLASGQVEIVARWLAEFHPAALVELDYGGLVHLLDDERLQADESVAEVSVAVAALERGEVELTMAMYKRLLARWRAVQALESAN